jgi:hypothetical protein
MPYERFVIFLKSRSCTHYTHMPYSYNGSRLRKHAFHLDPLKNILLLHWEKTPKIFHIGFHQINAPSSCAISQIFHCRKEAWAMQKLFTKERKI